VSRLDLAVDAILAGEPHRDEWTELCVATVRLGAALAEWDNARHRYIKTRKANRVTPHTQPEEGQPR